METLEEYISTIPLITDTCLFTNVGKNPVIEDQTSSFSKNMRTEKSSKDMESPDFGR